MKSSLLAAVTVERILEAGVAEGHKPDSWKREPVSFHLLKAIRHATTAMLQLEHPDLPSRSQETPEDHLERALCRLAMALWIKRKRDKRSTPAPVAH